MASPTNNPRRTYQRTSRAQSIISDTPFSTPRPTPPPPTRRGRGVRAGSDAGADTPPPGPSENEKSIQKPGAAGKLPEHYFLPPTFPSPFTGTLEASLDAIQEWGRRHMSTTHGTLSTTSEPTTETRRSIQTITTTLLRPVSSHTNWPSLLYTLSHVEPTAAAPRQPRYVSEELLFLLTRTLLPEQIVENRKYMARLYDAKKQLAMRLVLRYDMLREWKMEAGTHHRDQAITIASVPPPPSSSRSQSQSQVKGGGDVPDEPVAVVSSTRFPARRARMPNIVSTIIAAPAGGFATHGVRERMKHHVTDLDSYLLLGDEEVAGWSDLKLLAVTCQVVLHWQWIRQNNEVLEEMEVHGWEELEGKADESEWIADDVKRNTAGGGGKKAVVKEED